MPEILDCNHLGERTVGCYLLDTPDGPGLLDCGSATTIPAVKSELAARGLSVADLRHIVLTHIHFDHAGAAGVLVRESPGITVWVSEVGAPHLIDPSRLEASARRIYGDAFDTLWGELAPIPESNLRLVGERVLGMECFPTPGHAKHHVSYLDGDGTLYAGDAVGIRIQPGSYIQPAVPPPDVDMEAFRATWDAIEERDPARLALIHFGVAEDARDHLERCREAHERWAERVRSGMSLEEFVALAERELRSSEDEAAPYYENAGSSTAGYAGLKRYWEKKAEAEARA